MSKPMPTVPPWHLWGTSVLHEQDATVLPAPNVFVGTQQLVNVRYGRPETWHWFFAAEILQAADIPNAVDSAVLTVRFEVSIGLGRANFLMNRRASAGVDGNRGFETLGWGWGVPLSGSQSAPRQEQIWSTQANGPNRIQTTAALATPIANPVSQLVAEQITVEAKVLYNRSAGALADRAQVQIAAFFSPVVHIRPDWYEDPAPVFAGGETEGR